jgi:hypothetical protein
MKFGCPKRSLVKEKIIWPNRFSPGNSFSNKEVAELVVIFYHCHQHNISILVTWQTVFIYINGCGSSGVGGIRFLFTRVKNSA